MNRTPSPINLSFKKPEGRAIPGAADVERSLPSSIDQPGPPGPPQLEGSSAHAVRSDGEALPSLSSLASEVDAQAEGARLQPKTVKSIILFETHLKM